MQLLTPQWGLAQMRYLFLPALTLFKHIGQKALLLAHQPSLLQPHKEMAWHGRNRGAIYNPPVQHRSCRVYQGHSEQRMGFGFSNSFVFVDVRQPQNCSNVQFLIQDHIAPKLLLLDNSKIKNLSSVSYNLPNFNHFG